MPKERQNQIKKTHGTTPAICLIGLLIICSSQTTRAEPGFGVSCGKSGCHTTNKNAMTTDTSDQLIGIRFNNIDIKPGTNTANAYIQFTADAAATNPTALIIEEIINKPSWQTGNPIVLIISGNGKRVATSYDGSPDSAPTLHVEFQ